MSGFWNYFLGPLLCNGPGGSFFPHEVMLLSFQLGGGMVARNGFLVLGLPVDRHNELWGLNR